jgi:hypothetical protein
MRDVSWVRHAEGLHCARCTAGVLISTALVPANAGSRLLVPCFCIAHELKKSKRQIHKRYSETRKEKTEKGFLLQNKKAAADAAHTQTMRQNREATKKASQKKSILCTE